ncbi:MAG: SigB/SigF/SigG family RNA polymerase sigma factor [Actinocatenispora sp.]
MTAAVRAEAAAPARRASPAATEHRDDERPQRLLQELVQVPADHPDRDALRGRVIEAFLPLAARQARRYARRGEPTEDLVQVATIGLIAAVDRYEPALGTSFYAFAIPTIRGELKRYFRDKGWMIQPPRRLQELSRSIESAAGRLAQRLGRAPTLGELADVLGAQVDEVLEAMSAADGYRAISLNTLASQDTQSQGTAELGDLLGGPDPALEWAADRVSLPSALAILSDRGRTAIALRFFHGQTQTEIGEYLGLSQMHVSRLISCSLAQMRAFLNGDPPVPGLKARAIRRRDRPRTGSSRSTANTDERAAS